MNQTRMNVALVIVVAFSFSIHVPVVNGHFFHGQRRIVRNNETSHLELVEYDVTFHERTPMLLIDSAESGVGGEASCHRDERNSLRFEMCIGGKDAIKRFWRELRAIHTRKVELVVSSHRNRGCEEPNGENIANHVLLLLSECHEMERKKSADKTCLSCLASHVKFMDLFEHADIRVRTRSLGIKPDGEERFWDHDLNARDDGKPKPKHGKNAKKRRLFFGWFINLFVQIVSGFLHVLNTLNNLIVHGKFDGHFTPDLINFQHKFINKQRSVVSIQGQIGAVLGSDIQINIQNFKLQLINISLIPSFTSDITTSISHSASLADVKKSLWAFRWNVYFQLGPIPMLLTPQLALFFQASVQVEAEVTYEAKFEMGARLMYTKVAGSSAKWTMTRNQAFDWNLQRMGGTATADIAVTAQLSVGLFWWQAIGAFIAPFVELHVAADPAGGANGCRLDCNANFGLKFGVGLVDQQSGAVQAAEEFVMKWPLLSNLCLDSIFDFQSRMLKQTIVEGNLGKLSGSGVSLKATAVSQLGQNGTTWEARVWGPLRGFRRVEPYVTYQIFETNGVTMMKVRKVDNLVRLLSTGEECEIQYDQRLILNNVTSMFAVSERKLIGMLCNTGTTQGGQLPSAWGPVAMMESYQWVRGFNVIVVTHQNETELMIRQLLLDVNEEATFLLGNQIWSGYYGCLANGGVTHHLFTIEMRNTSSGVVKRSGRGDLWFVVEKNSLGLKDTTCLRSMALNEVILCGGWTMTSRRNAFFFGATQKWRRTNQQILCSTGTDDVFVVNLTTNSSSLQPIGNGNATKATQFNILAEIRDVCVKFGGGWTNCSSGKWKVQFDMTRKNDVSKAVAGFNPSQFETNEGSSGSGQVPASLNMTCKKIVAGEVPGVVKVRFIRRGNSFSDESFGFSPKSEVNKSFHLIGQANAQCAFDGAFELLLVYHCQAEPFDWVDGSGQNCSVISQKSECKTSGQMRACCACGGGCSNIAPRWADQNGKGCDHYCGNPSTCNDTSATSDAGVLATTACCCCGGGVTGLASNPNFVFKKPPNTVSGARVRLNRCLVALSWTLVSVFFLLI